MRVAVDPKGSPRAVLVDKLDAASSQLETAIKLWFDGGDPISIHTLAAAAHDCFHELAKQAGRPSDVRSWISSKSKTFQKKATEAQNFFKHGARHPKSVFQYEPIYGEMLMMDCVTCWLVLHGRLSALTAIYRARFFVEHPDVIRHDVRDGFFESLNVHQVDGSSRKEFLEKLLPSTIALLASRRR